MIVLICKYLAVKKKSLAGIFEGYNFSLTRKKKDLFVLKNVLGIGLNFVRYKSRSVKTWTGQTWPLPFGTLPSFYVHEHSFMVWPQDHSLEPLHRLLQGKQINPLCQNQCHLTVSLVMAPINIFLCLRDWGFGCIAFREDYSIFGMLACITTPFFSPLFSYRKIGVPILRKEGNLFK